MWSYNFAQKLISDYGVYFDVSKVAKMIDDELVYEYSQKAGRKGAKSKEHQQTVEARIISWVSSERVQFLSPMDLCVYRVTWLFFHMVDIKK